MSKNSLVIGKRSSKLLPAVRASMVAMLVRRPNTGRTVKERRRIEAEEQRQVSAALKRLRGKEEGVVNKTNALPPPEEGR